MSKLLSAAILFLCAVLASCSSGGGGGGGGGSSKPTPVATAVGTPMGSAATATIGPAGGSLMSSDNKLTINIPASALTTTAVISIQPITNTAHGKIGSGYRLTPDGQTFQQPVSLTFTYTAQDLVGSSADVLGVAYQSSDGYWHWLANPAVSPSDNSVTAATTHFTDFSMVQGLNLRPGKASVRVGQSKTLEVRDCYAAAVSDDPELAPLPGFDCNAEQLAPLPGNTVTEWAVNGVVNGNSTYGYIGGGGLTGLFHAPSTKPVPDTVTASARLAYKNKETLLLSNITILGSDYAGTVQWVRSISATGTITSSASITWTLYQGSTAQAAYSPSGTISAHVDTGNNCDPVDIQRSIAPGIPAGGGVMIVNLINPQQYFFQFMAAGAEISQTCHIPNSTATYTSTMTVAHLDLTIPLTSNLPWMTFTDETSLSGSYSSDYLTSSSWTFTAQ